MLASIAISQAIAMGVAPSQSSSTTCRLLPNNCLRGGIYLNPFVPMCIFRGLELNPVIHCLKVVLRLKDNVKTNLMWPVKMAQQQMNNFLNYHAYLRFKVLEKDFHNFILFFPKIRKNKSYF